MTRDLVLEIATLALTVLKTFNETTQRDGFVNDVVIKDSILEMIRKGVQAYEAHTGDVLDPALIKAEAPL